MKVMARAGIILDEREPNLARQNPGDYLKGIEVSILQTLAQARKSVPGFDPKRIVVVRDGATLAESVSPDGHPATAAIREGYQFVALHAGNLGFYGAWKTLVDAARELQDEGVGLVFVGGGAQRGQVENLAGGMRGVRLLPFRPAAEIPFVLAAADKFEILHRVSLGAPSYATPAVADGEMCVIPALS